MLFGFLMSLKQQLANVGESDDRITPLHGSILISELMKFSDNYEKVIMFLETVKSLDVLCYEFNYGGATLRNGMYIQALGDGLTEVEKLYYEDFGKLESALLSKESVPELAVVNPTDGNSTSFHFASNINSVYSKILQIINILVANNLHGCQIIDLCLKFKYFLPEEIFYLLLNHLNKPLLKQITSWIVFGKIEDPRDEFFIKKIESDIPGNSTSHFNATTSTMAIVEEHYEIDNNYLPLHVPFSFGNMILNTGRLMSLLRNAPSDEDNLPGFQTSDSSADEKKIIQMMQELEKGDNYHLSEVEKVVHYVWNSVNKVK